jgi:hypothetical protein
MLQNVLLLLLPVVGFIIFGYMALTIPVNGSRNVRFVLATVVYFALISFCICLTLYGSAYQVVWDYSHWRWGDSFGPFPIDITNGVGLQHIVPKSSSTYWWLLWLGTSFYVTFPQSVLRALNLYVFSPGARVIVGLISNFIGLGEGFLALLVTFTAIGSPVPVTNGWVMLLGCALVFLLSGYDFADIGPFFLIPILRGFGLLVQRILQGGAALAFIGVTILAMFAIVPVPVGIGIDLGAWITRTPVPVHTGNAVITILGILGGIVGFLFVAAIASGIGYIIVWLMRFLGIQRVAGGADSEQASAIA